MTGKIGIISAFCLSVAVLIFLGAYAYRSTDQYKSASNWVTHTQEVISEAQVILLDIQRIETAQRGYVITGELRYLESYNVDITAIEQEYKKLRELISDNRNQQTLLDTIHQRINSKIQFAQEVIRLRKEQGIEPAQKLVASDLGEGLMRKVKALTDNFIANEDKLLSTRLNAAEQSFSFTRKVIIATIGFTIVIVLVTLFFFIKDFNKRITSEKKVIESEYKIKQFLESLPVGVFVLGVDGKPYYANGKSQEILGKGIVEGSTAEQLPEIYKTYVAGTDTAYPADKLPIVRALAGEKDICVEDLEIDKKGTRIPLRINATNITNSKGETEYAIAAFENVTDIREAEKKLREARKLAEESSNLKEVFLANMSHEIRTPMNAIIGFTDLLLKRKLGETERDYVQTIKTSSENLLRIINDVLDISKIEAGMMSFETHTISIRELFSSLSIMLSQKAKDRNLSLSFSYDPNIPQVILGDPTRLTQILINLVGNGIKFTSSGGVTVFAKVREEKQEEYRIEFTVKDTGIGIPSDKLSRVFERFTQAESHTTRNYGGTGLGLSIVKQLVELQGGSVKVESTVGSGSLFTFDLPFKKASEAIYLKSKFQVHENTADLSSKRILVVEDNPVNIKFIMSLFETYNIKPDLAENGKVAVEKVKNGQYDVVLMDLEMPVVNGYEATAIIRNDLKSKVPIIAMTAHAMAGEQQKCLQMGMNGYVSKPIRENILMQKLFDVTVDDVSTNSSGNSRQLLNLEFLIESMRGRKDVIRETIDIILRQLPEDMAVLTTAVTTNDLETIRNFSHRIKSTMSLIGVITAENLLEEIETLAGQKEEMKKITPIYEVLSPLCKRALEELQTERLKYM